jgi:hypothetical protein
MEPNYETLYQELAALVAKGDEDGVQAFLENTFPTLPEEVQGDVLLALITDGLMRNNREHEAIAHIQKEGLEAIKTIEE